jgi:hypothetical protein
LDILKERICVLKQDHDRASVALERAKEGARQHIEITPALIEEFGYMMREKIGSGDNAFRKTYISAIIDRVEADPCVAVDCAHFPSCVCLAGSRP